MSDTIKELIKRFDKHKNVSEAKFQFLLDLQKSMEKALLEMQEESSDFYSIASKREKLNPPFLFFSFYNFFRIP